MTLIELLIVIAIIGILAAVAIPYYRSQYLVKARLAEVTLSMGAVGSSVASYYAERNLFPSAGNIGIIKSSLGVSVPTNRISGMNVLSGEITATVVNIDSTIDGATLVMTPGTDLRGSMVWFWGGTIPSIYLPR